MPVDGEKGVMVFMNVLNIEHVSKIFGDKKIFDDISYGIHDGDKIGIIGINGTGKSTLLKIIAGEEETDEGQVISQNGLRITYLPQMPDFPKGAIVQDYVADGKWQKDWSTESEARNILNKLGITEHDVPVEQLSGGQKKRVALARTLVNPSDVLILDEPTNHLDIASKEILEEALVSYTGTVLYVSHDRYFINQTATRIMELTNQAVVNYIGDYDYYLEKKEELTSAYAPDINTPEAPQEEKAASENKLSWQQQKEEQARQRKRENELKREAELKKVEARIEELETRDKEIDDTMVLPDVCTNVAECTKLSREKADIAEELEELYEKWEELA